MVGAADAAAKAEETHGLIRGKPLSWYPVVPVDDDEEETEAWWCGWLPRAFSPFPRPDTEPIRAGVPLTYQQLQRFHRPTVLGRLERLDRDRNIVQKCLGWYNTMHPVGDEYEPAPGAVTEGSRLNRGMCWTHGNFVARRKLSGCFSFLPAPRTLFFFELRHRGKNINEVVTCTPLDEPVTEAYNFLGFHVEWGSRRCGDSDCVCRTCYRRHPYAMSTCVCEDSKVEPVCDMCYPRIDVIHPIQGGFALGYDTKLDRDFYRPDHCFDRKQS